MTQTDKRMALLPPALVVMTIGCLVSAESRAGEWGDAELLSPFVAYDFDADGVSEIESLAPLFDSPSVHPEGRPLLVLIESRLLGPLDEATGPSIDELEERLRAYDDALKQAGWSPWFVKTSVYAGATHQDGKTLLAMRRLLQRLWEVEPKLSGVILIGSFPEASLVRRWVWKHDSREAVFNGERYNSRGGPRATFVAMDPELIAPRTDLVLADLDGEWESLYHQAETEIESLKILPRVADGMAWPRRDEPLEVEGWSVSRKKFEDFFWIEDADFELTERDGDTPILRASYQPLRPELTAADRKQPNPIARPEISVSRINPRHIAVEVGPDDVDAVGRPVAVPATQGSPHDRLHRSAALERTLLIEYLDRNVAYRTGEYPAQSRRCAVLSTDLRTVGPSYFDGVAKDFGPTVDVRRATAVDFVRFLATPALLKAISAHSDPGCSIMLGGYEMEELDALTGGGYWYWRLVDERFEPSYTDGRVRNRIHFALLRALWQNGTLREAGPSFYLHAGCEVNTPAESNRVPYNHSAYGGHEQIGENLLFYANGLALMARAKVFYDAPRGFAESIAEPTSNFGSALSAYYRHEADDERLGRDVAGYNRVYFWSILGDWTLSPTR
ncbi:MAG: hypothetical protein KDA83_08005 [Planctomycetales bacterium]|nr:hypothetical protein [Planctomycetales bacterium]